MGGGGHLLSFHPILYRSVSLPLRTSLSLRSRYGFTSCSPAHFRWPVAFGFAQVWSTTLGCSPSGRGVLSFPSAPAPLPSDHRGCFLRRGIQRRRRRDRSRLTREKRMLFDCGFSRPLASSSPLPGDRYCMPGNRPGADGYSGSPFICCARRGRPRRRRRCRTAPDRCRLPAAVARSA